MTPTESWPLWVTRRRRRTAGRRSRRRRRRAAPVPSPCRRGPTSGRGVTSSVSSSPGPTWRRNRAPSRPPNSGSLPAKRSSVSTAIAPTWAIASHISTPGQRRPPREVTGEEPLVARQPPPARRRLTGDEVGDLVDEQERRPVRQDIRRPRQVGHQADRRQQVLRRVGRADLVPGLGHLALLVDQERRPLDAHVLAAVHALLLPHPERLGDGVVGIGEQREPESVLLGELELLRRLVRADPDDGSAADVAEDVVEPARLLRAARRVGLRVEVDEHLAPAQRAQRHLLVVLVGEVEVGCAIPWLEHGGHPTAGRRRRAPSSHWWRRRPWRRAAACSARRGTPACSAVTTRPRATSSNPCPRAWRAAR